MSRIKGVKSDVFLQKSEKTACSGRNALPPICGWPILGTLFKHIDVRCVFNTVKETTFIFKYSRCGQCLLTISHLGNDENENNTITAEPPLPITPNKRGWPLFGGGEVFRFSTLHQNGIFLQIIAIFQNLRVFLVNFFARLARENSYPPHFFLLCPPPFGWVGWLR